MPGIKVTGRPYDSGMGCPAYFSSAGLGSNVSMWLGPPFMKHQMTDLAVGLWCGFLAASGPPPAAAKSLSPNSEVSAKAPSPLPA